MISTTSEYDAALSRTSRSFRCRLMEGNTALGGEIRRATVHIGSCGTSSFTPGAVFSSYAEITVAEPGLTFEGRALQLQIGIKPVGFSWEYITIGCFTAGRPSTSVYETTFLAYGSIAAYFTDAFTPPANQTVANVISALETQTGTSIVLSGLTAAGTITKDMTGLTCRDALGVVAGVLGGYATERNDGTVVIAKFTGTATFSVDGSRMTELPTFADSNTAITGVRVTVPTDGAETVYESGTVNVERTDAYMTQALFTAYAANLTGLTYRAGTAKLALGDPRLEPWDVLAVTDMANNTFALPCMNVTHTFDGGLATEIRAPGLAEEAAILTTTGRALREAQGAAAAAAASAASASAAAAEALAQASEFIVGTQSAATGAWTGTCSALNELVDGTQITYWLPFAYATTGASAYTPTGGTSATGANLALTLANGTTTAAIPCFYGGVIRLTNHYAAGNAIHLTYRENVTIGSVTVAKGWWADANYDTNYYDRTRYNSNIKAAAAITASHIIAGTSAGYKNLAASLAFDLSYPLLYAGSKITSGSTGTNNYTAYPNINFSTTGTIQSGTTAKAIYLKGTMSGTTFTLAASNWLTTVVPSAEDGFYYIPLGVMSSATNGSFVSSNQLWAYVEGAFQPVGVGAINAVAAEKTARENAISTLSQALAAAGGLYETTETPSGGGTIYYLHDKPTKAASLLVIKLTASALGISTDGGANYAQGWNFATGTTITNILSAIGVDANWINAGSITADFLKLYGAMSVYRSNTFTLQNLGGLIGFTSGNAQSNIEQGIVQVSQNYHGVSIVGNAGVFIGFHGTDDPWFDGGDIKINDANYPTYILMQNKEEDPEPVNGEVPVVDKSGCLRIGGTVYINNREILAEIGTLSSLTTTAKTSLVAAINELASSGGGGGGSGATAMATIYENSSPSSSQANGALTLAESIADIDFFYFESAWSKDYPSNRDGKLIYVPSGSTVNIQLEGNYYSGNTEAHAFRQVTINRSNNTITLGKGTIVTDTYGAVENNEYAIVTRVLGFTSVGSILGTWQGGNY